MDYSKYILYNIDCCYISELHKIYLIVDIPNTMVKNCM